MDTEHFPEAIHYHKISTLGIGVHTATTQTLF